MLFEVVIVRGCASENNAASCEIGWAVDGATQNNNRNPIISCRFTEFLTTV